jgi:hypothetical protein
VRTIATALGILAATGFTVIAAVMNWRYGLSLGRSADDQLLFAAAGLVIDVSKILMPFFAWWAIRNRRWLAGTLASMAFVGCVAYSITGIAGFADLARANTSGTLIARKETAAGLRADLQRKQTQLAALASVAPVAALELRLDGLRQDVRWRTTRACTDATAATSRDYCKQIRDLEADRARSAAALKLEGEIEQLRERIAELAGVAEIDRGDPRAGILSRFTGWEFLRVQTGLSLLFVGIIEFMSAFGLFIALNHGELVHGRTQPIDEPIREADHPAHVPPKPPGISSVLAPADLQPDAVRTDSDATVAQIATFAIMCLEPKAGARVLVRSLYPRYRAWCATYASPLISPEAFLVAFRQLCVRSGFPISGEGDALIAEDLVTRA